jgi:hypothetical protein
METAAQRFARDYGSMEAERKDNQLDAQSAERKARLYVNSADGSTPADD